MNYLEKNYFYENSGQINKLNLELTDVLLLFSLDLSRIITWFKSAKSSDAVTSFFIQFSVIFKIRNLTLCLKKFTKISRYKII